MSAERRAHKDSCSCQACVYQRAKLRLPVAQVRRVQDEPSYRPGLYLALDEIAELVATYAPDDWSGSCEDARRAIGRTMACGHWHAREIVLCPDCGETWDFGE